jgi:hypothetical protein
MKKPRKSRVIGAKVTEEEYDAFVDRARRSGISASQFARQHLMAAISLPLETRFLAAELLAFQETFLALILASLRAEPLNESRVSELRARFAGIKSALVDQAIERFHSTHSGDL